MIYFMGFDDELCYTDRTEEDINNHVRSFTYSSDNNAFIEKAVSTNDLQENVWLFNDLNYYFHRKLLFSNRASIDISGGLVPNYRVLVMLMREFTSN